MATKTNKGLVAYAREQLGKPYWFGTFGQAGSSTLLTQKARQYPAEYTASNVSNCQKQYGVKVHDCIGLIKGYLWSDSAADTTPRYNAAQDQSANSMYNICKERGYINTMPDLEGVLVFMSGHVGVYIGNGEVIEAMNFNRGVVKTKLAGRGWQRWGKCPYITYASKTSSNSGSNAASTATKKVTDEIAKAVISGEYGNGDERKAKLKAAGYNPDDVQDKVNELLEKEKAAAAKKTPKVGAKVKLTGKYASSSVSKSAGNSKAIGKTAYIVKIYEGKAFPYQIGTKKGDNSNENTIGFAKANAFELL